MAKHLALITIVCLSFVSCDKSEDVDEQTVLIETLNQELVPLSEDPLLWSDSELTFLDELADRSIVALGEATHGTAEFFQAKHRIFRYLAENHGYKVFAFEADFGESILINEAIQSGNCSAIEELMKSKMHFWTWRTEEVLNLLQWMCQYNLSKSDLDKLQYVGFDCQFNTFHPEMLESYLTSLSPSFLPDAEIALAEAKLTSDEGFDNYTDLQFNEFNHKLFKLRNSMNSHEEELIAQSSQKEYDLNLRILDLISQVSKVRYDQANDVLGGLRDQFMAENTSWFLDYYDEKIVTWAHNGHIANDSHYNGGSSMGYHLRNEHGDNYTTIGFLFSKGTFTAVGHDGQQFTSLETQSIDEEPSINSINYIMSKSEPLVFSIEIQDLQKHNEWNNSIDNLVYFQIGSVFIVRPENHYSTFNSSFFDRIIYIENSTATKLLPF